ncbi:MAG: hypothetical protein Q8S12_17245 [Hydrogenophaga sp.]|uniref:hypothetical protein n=1 Tax=Hydrogenophaga sp. TaxID=1904254 RepID=UPI00273337E9|nr:hypothetical protein [Hydrogenophaga sp.]MDP3628332.1 hypothetical protein [Hydrogenophaga sp.]
MKTFFTIGLAMLVSLGTAASAQGLPLQTTTGAEIGIQVSSYRYEEDRNGSFFMSLDGKKLGLSGSFTQTYGDRWFWGGDARYASGNADYASASTGSKSANPDSYVDARLTFGRDFDVGDQVLAPYTGLGYRYLSSDLRGYSTTGAAGYRRTSNYIYLPLGVTHRFRMGPDARFATTFEYDYLLQGMQRSYMTDIPSGGYDRDLNNLQRRGYGLRLDMAYETDRWSAGVFYHYWNIADSDIGVYTAPGLVYSGYEPHNITREAGVQVKVRFR